MSNALEQASLIMVPSGYEDGTLGSLKPTDGTGDFTFSRGSDISATRVNEDGYIEKGYENLLEQSNSFTTTWTTSGTSVTSGQSGYDGSSDAWLLEASSDGQFKFAAQNLSSSGVNTFSCYAKSGTTDYIRIQINAGSTAFAYFDLTAGVSGTTLNEVTTNIEAVSGATGWYRCSLVVNDSSISSVRIYVARENSVNVITGDNIYIQDAMLNQGMVAYPYVETTTAPVAGGILEDMPRLDYSNGSCPSLLLEPSRTNLILHSEYFDAAYWNKSNVTIEFGHPSPEGYDNAYRVQHLAQYSVLRRLSTLPAGNTTLSVWLKRIDGNSNYTFYGGGSSKSITITDEWNRYDFSFVANGTNNTFFGIQDTNTSGFGSYYIYGAQAEQNATYPTSYIPTYGVSQTRLGETTSALTLPEPLTDNYTLFFDFKEINTVNNWIAFLDSSNNPVYTFYGYSGHYDVNNGSAYILESSADPNGKIALQQSGSSIKVFVNGVDKTKSGATANLTDIVKFRFANRNSNNSATLRQMLVFTEALSDEACIELTTIS